MDETKSESSATASSSDVTGEKETNTVDTTGKVDGAGIDKAPEEDISIALKAANIDAVHDLVKEISCMSENFNTDDQKARIELMAKAKKVSNMPSLHCELNAGTDKDLWTYLAEINGPFKVAEVAEAKQIDPPLLSRLLRHISAMGYLTEVDFDTYKLNNFSKLMAFPFINAGYPCIGDNATLLVDIGGSFGHDISEFQRKFSDSPGRLILQDLPVVIDQVTKLDDRIERMKYDFYTEQPIKGARAPVLSSAMGAMKPGYSKLLINENVIPNTGAQWEATALEVMMLTLLASRERTLENWENLLGKAGLKICNIWTVANGVESLIECELA
ncbi:hypothetical protein FZEAL_3706 [Fusarium zealandicum]|uniref:O-methyltransferase n=1 Tax=Fusarium zealandicum TaxID=1053134 RepID=A0A8H4XMN8_9HYPO|nr:hypothetical protein FZEAL_3706 [Fusarium zealandicum]